jgi:hypothetical protein
MTISELEALVRRCESDSGEFNKPQFRTVLQKRPDPLQAQPFPCFHADGQCPACRIAPPGSSCVSNQSSLQAHLV